MLPALKPEQATVEESSAQRVSILVDVKYLRWDVVVMCICPECPLPPTERVGGPPEI